jgi:hypothetical protein
LFQTTGSQPGSLQRMAAFGMSAAEATDIPGEALARMLVNPE